MKLIKTANQSTLKLPRIGALIEVLRDTLPELYAELDSEHPEVAATAEVLADHFETLDPETKLFRSFSFRTPFESVNPELMRVGTDVQAQVKNIADAAGLTGDANKHLINIVVGEALQIAYLNALRSDHRSFLSAIVGRQLEGTLFKTAAIKNVNNEHEGPGKKFRYPKKYRVPEQRAPSFSDMTDLYASLAYNAAFNAMVTNPALFGETDEAKETSSYLRSQLAVNFETHNFLSLAHKELKSQLSTGRRLFAGGNPLSPNPSIGTFFGAEHTQWFGTVNEAGEEVANTHRPEAIMQLFASGTEGGAKGTKSKVPYLPGNIISRKYLYQKENPNMIVEEWSGRAATASTKVLSAKYMDDEAKFKTDLAKTLVSGFQTNLNLLRGNGIPLNKFRSVLGLKDQATFDAVKNALTKILARLPTVLEAGPEGQKAPLTLAQVATMCEQAIEAERPDFEAKVQAKSPAFLLNNPHFSDLLDAAAQLTLRLPVSMAKKFDTFNPMSILPPLPRNRETKLGDLNPGIKKLFGEQSNTTFTTLMSALSKSGRGMPGVVAVINKLNNSKDKSVALFATARAVAAEAAGGPSVPRERKAFMEKLIFLFTEIVEAIDEMPEGKIEALTGSDKEAVRSLISELRKDEAKKMQLVAAIFIGALDSIGINTSQIDVGSLFEAFAAENDNAPVIYQVAELVSNSIPEEFNDAAESLVESKYSNMSEYRKAHPELLSSDDPEMKLDASHIQHRASMMFEGSMLNGLKVMMSNAYVAKFDQNAKDDAEYIKKNYREDIATEVDMLRAKQLEEAASDLEGFVTGLGLSFEASDLRVEPYQHTPEFKYSGTEMKRQKSVGDKFQKFFEENSRESLKQKLQAAGFDPNIYIDPLVVLLARKMHMALSNKFQERLEKSNLGVRAGNAGGISDTDRAQGQELLSAGLGEDEAPGKGRYAETNDYSEFSSDWGTKVRFHQSGGLSTQCLAGFLAETLAKNDLAEKDGLDGAWAKKYRDNFHTGGKGKSGRAPIIGLAINRVGWAYGKVHHDAGLEQLDKLFAAQVALNRHPQTQSELAVMGKVPFDPVFAATVFAGGRTTDKISQLYRILRRTSIRGTDNWDDFEADFKAGVTNFEREMDLAIADLPTEQDKALCYRLIEESKAATRATWAPAPDDIEELRDLGYRMTQMGQVRDERLWKMAFESNAGMTLVANFVKNNVQTKTELQAKDVLSRIRNSRIIKTDWQKNMDEVLGTTGLLNKDDTEKLSIALNALQNALSNNIAFVTLSDEQQTEVAQELVAAQNAEAIDTETAEAVEKKVITVSDKMSSMMNVFVRADPDLNALQLAVQGDTEVFDEDFNIATTEVEAMKSAANTLYTIEMAMKRNPSALDKEAAAYVAELTEGMDDDELEANPELEALSSTSGKGLYLKFAKLGPSYLAGLKERINGKLAILKQEMLRILANTELEEESSQSIKIARDLQKQTAHLATYQGWVAEGKEIVLAEVPALPKIGKYRKTFQGFVDFNANRIDNWLKNLAADNQLRDLEILDNSLRAEGKDILSIKVEDVASLLDAEAAQNIKDTIVRAVYDVKSKILKKKTYVEQVRATVAEITDEEFEKFEAEYKEASEELSDTFKAELGLPANRALIAEPGDEDGLDLVDEDQFELTDEDMDISSDEFDITDGTANLTDKERGQRAKSAAELEKMVGAVQTVLMRPKTHELYRKIGKEFANQIRETIQQIDFTGKFNHKQMDAVTEILRRSLKDIIANGEALVATPDAPDAYQEAQDETINFFEGILADIEEAFGADEVRVTDIQVAPSANRDPSKPPPLPTKEQRLNSEIIASLKVVDEAIELATEGSIERAALGNARTLLMGLAPENRLMAPTVDLKVVTALVESVVEAINSDTLFQMKPAVMEAMMKKFRSIGISTKSPLKFQELKVSPVAKNQSEDSVQNTDNHDRGAALFSDLKKINAEIGKFILKVPEAAHEAIGALDLHFEEFEKQMEKINLNRAFSALTNEDIETLELIKNSLTDVITDLNMAKSAQDFADFESNEDLVIGPLNDSAALIDQVKGQILAHIRKKASVILNPVKVKNGWVF